MASELLGRTNRTFPKVWRRLSIPLDWGTQSVSNSYLQVAVHEGTVIDISSSPAYWGSMARGSDALLMVRGGIEIEHAPDARLACDLIQAHLVQTLSAVGREWIDFYFLQIRTELLDPQIDGALAALENAKQEGHVRFLGIECVNDNPGVRLLWERRDAFEVALLNKPDRSLIDLAKRRRVGILTTFESEYTVLRPFASRITAGVPQ